MTKKVLIVGLIICGFWILILYGELYYSNYMQEFYRKSSIDSIEARQTCDEEKKALLNLYANDYGLGLDDGWNSCLKRYDFSGPNNISDEINFAYWNIQHCDKGAFPLGKFRCWVYYNEAKIEDDTYTWITSNDGTYKIVSSYEYGEW